MGSHLHIAGLCYFQNATAAAILESFSLRFNKVGIVVKNEIIDIVLGVYEGLR